MRVEDMSPVALQDSGRVILLELDQADGARGLLGISSAWVLKDFIKRVRAQAVKGLRTGLHVMIAHLLLVVLTQHHETSQGKHKEEDQASLDDAAKTDVQEANRDIEPSGSQEGRAFGALLTVQSSLCVHLGGAPDAEDQNEEAVDG